MGTEPLHRQPRTEAAYSPRLPERINRISGGVIHGHVIQAGGDVTIHYPEADSSTRTPGASVSIAAPLGLRDPDRPLRGRGKDIRQLVRLVSGPSGGTIHVLCGPGGCGKTALALEVVHRVPFRSWWVDARQSASLEAGLLTVARRLGAADSLHGGDPADVLWDRLARLARPWLLVVDNADDPAMLDGLGRLAAGTGWIRPHTAPNGHVLVTSRDGDHGVWGQATRLHRLGVLEEHAAVQALLDQTGERAGTPADAARLARRLGGLPLALRTAGRYLAESALVPTAFRETAVPTDFPTYLDALAERPELVDPDRALAGAWELSFDLLDRRGMACARDLIRLLSAFADAPVPYTLLLHLPTLTTDARFTSLDGTHLWGHLSAMADLGLLDLSEPGDDAPELLHLHPLVRAFNADDSLLPLAVNLLHQAAATGIPPGSHGAPRRPAADVLAAHARHLGQRAADLGAPDTVLQPALAAAADAAVYHREIGLFQQAHADLEGLHTAARRRWDEEHPAVLAVRHARATTLRTLGRLHDAESELRALVEIERYLVLSSHLRRQQAWPTVRDIRQVGLAFDAASDSQDG